MSKREYYEEIRIDLVEPTEVSPALGSIDILHDYLDSLLQQVTEDDGFNYRQKPSFECVLFELCSFKFLTPVSQVAAILNLDNERVGTIFKRGHLRMLRSGQDLWKTMDTATLLNLDAQPTYRMALCVEATGWAVPVDKVIGTEIVKPGDVRWRDTRASMQWYPGIHLEQMCRIFDLYGLIEARLSDISSNTGRDE